MWSYNVNCWVGSMPAAFFSAVVSPAVKVKDKNQQAGALGATRIHTTLLPIFLHPTFPTETSRPLCLTGHVCAFRHATATVLFATDTRSTNIAGLLWALVHFIPGLVYAVRLQRLCRPHAVTNPSQGPAAPRCAPCLQKVSLTLIAADLQKLFYIMVTALYLLSYNNRVITTISKNKTTKSY